MSLRNILIFLFFLSFMPAQAQQPLFRSYAVTDGLVSNTVWCVGQDNKGYMWFGTKNGLSRFDGYQFKSYRFDKNNPQSLGNNFITAIAAADERHLWIGTQMGVYVLDLEKERFSPLALLKNQSVYDIVRDKSGSMWVATRSNGVYRFGKKPLHFHENSKAGRLSSNHVRKLTFDHSGRIWIGTFGKGIDVYDPATRQVQNLNRRNSALSSDQVLSLYTDLSGDVWVGTFAGGLNVYRQSTRNFSVFRAGTRGGINDDIVRSIYQPAPGKLYVGTEKGLNILDLSTGQSRSYTKRTNDPYSISDNAIYAIYPDREGGIWVGTYFGGISYFTEKGLGFELYYQRDGMPSLSGNAVSSFLEDTPGKFWIGTEDGGLNLFDERTRSFKKYPWHSGQQALSYHNIHCLYKDARGRIWIGTFAGGLNIYDPASGSVRNYRHEASDPRSLSNDNIYVIYEDRDKQVWIGTTKGLNRYDPASDSFFRVGGMDMDKNVIYDIYEDNTKTVWFATYDAGLVAFNKRSQTWSAYRAGRKNALSSDKIISLLDDHAGNLWIGTDGGGLNRLNMQDKTVQVFDESQGLDANVIYGMLQDDSRNLWLSTNNGLYTYLPGKKVFRHYTNWDHLQSLQFNYGASYKSSSGKLYFGGIKGFNAFFPDSVRQLSGRQEVVITNFQLFNRPVSAGVAGSPLQKPIDYTQKLTLSHSQSVISFEYAALSYLAPNKVQYAYRMQGFDKGWNYVGSERKATYTNLPAGNYVFQVKAMGNDGNWNSHVTTLQIRVNPPFYLSVWAYIFYALALAGAFWLFRHYTIKETRRKNQIRLERLKSRKEKEFYTQKLEFFTAMAHEIRTPLSLIIAPLEKLLQSRNKNTDEQAQLAIMEENSNRLLNLVNQLLDFRRIESDVYAIHQEEIELVSFIHTIYSRFSSIPYQKGIRFTMSTKISSLQVQIDPEAFTKIMNNLLINAFKFTRSKVKISIDEPETRDGRAYFSVSVEDDGIGIPPSQINNIFSKFFKVSSGAHQYSNLGGTGIGLSLARSLVEKHEGVLEVRSQEQVNTVFKLLVPYEPAGAAVAGKAVAAVKEPEGEGLLTILVAEDDESLNDFIGNGLAEAGYRVIKAFNGFEAQELLAQYQVDLIISDIMMPVTDGMEFLKAVKENIDHSHIPFILLTARANSESEIEGITLGADAYLIKPFKWKHVLAVVKNLVESRNKLREKFARQPFAPANSLTTNSRDKKFIDKVTGIIEERMMDPQLSVEELSKDLAMSRSSLHKKLKSLSGYVPNEFIRLIRLKKAAELILSEDYNISEISYLVGFNSHSYFSKCFVSQFKVPPSEFLEKHREKIT
ncbi:hypothetical protein C7T94_09550 [Pedobacter yulinensis]|uniref:histidine kinase n=1 Tax=Pedobacter yulinensis TaxID=2126353 RepID=A0A2T3HKB8_9SPHI|nr:hybrid sensor histidine kinase/response regulator transcription factor [Pedobacter yulinensis]PST82870.1 hypothetical protein C7T94_09550 [Pedobacter yulinensis]